MANRPRRRWTRAELIERRREGWDLYVAGWTQRQIAEKFGIDQSTVSDDFAALRAETPRQTREQLIEKHQEGLAWATKRLRELAEKPAPPITAGAQGLIVHDPRTGEIVRDYALQRQAALDLVRLQEREAKLLGLNAADVVEHTGTVTVAGSVDAELNELAAKLGMQETAVVPPCYVAEGLSEGVGSDALVE